MSKVKFPVKGGVWRTAEKGAYAVLEGGSLVTLTESGYVYYGTSGVGDWEDYYVEDFYVDFLVERIPFPISLPTGLGAVIDRGDYTGAAYFPYVRGTFNGSGVWYDSAGGVYYEDNADDKEFMENLLKNDAVVMNEGYNRE